MSIPVTLPTGGIVHEPNEPETMLEKLIAEEHPECEHFGYIVSQE